MFELLKSLVNAAAFERLFSFCRRAASRLAKRLKRSGLRAAKNILETAQGVLSWVRRIGAMLGRSLSRPLQPIRDAFRAIVQASASKLRQTSAAVIPPYNAKPRASGFGRATGQRPIH